MMLGLFQAEKGFPQAFNPTIQVAADGTLGVSYYDFRFNDPNPATLPTDAWIVFCRPATPQASTNPAHWGGEVRLTDVSFDIKRAPLTTGGLTGGGSFLGEYEGLAWIPTEGKPLTMAQY